MQCVCSVGGAGSCSQHILDQFGAIYYHTMEKWNEKSKVSVHVQSCTRHGKEDSIIIHA